MTVTSSPVLRNMTRRFTRVGAAATVALIGSVTAVSPAHAASTLPPPTAVVVAGVTSRSISLNVGGSTVKTYNIFVNGNSFVNANPSSATVPLTIRYLLPNTTYSIAVQEIVVSSRSSRVSPLSAPITVRTAPPLAVAPVTNLRVVSSSRTEITVAWDASTTPDVR
jgi:hypothetical protein